MKAKRTKTKRPILKNLANFDKVQNNSIPSNGNDSNEREQNLDLDSEEKNQNTVTYTSLVQSEDNLKSHNTIKSTLKSLIIEEATTTGPQTAAINEEQEAVNLESQDTALSKTFIVPLEKENTNEVKPILQCADSDVTTSSALSESDQPESPISSNDYELLQSPLLDTDQLGMGTASDKDGSVLEGENCQGLKDMQMVSISYAEVLPDDNDPNYYCRVCKMTSDSRSSFYTHLTDHHKMILKPLVWWRISDLDKNNPDCYCKLCKKKYKSVYSFHVHIKNMHKKKRRRTLRVIKEKPSFSCTTCYQVLASKFSLQRHMHKIHNTSQSQLMPDINNPDYYCPVCDKKSPDKAAFRVHLRYVHAIYFNPSVQPDKDDPDNYCATCDQSFLQRHSFLQHLWTYHDISMIASSESSALMPDVHDPDRHCSVCDRKFATNQSFRYHIYSIHVKKTEFKTRNVSNSNEDPAPSQTSPHNKQPPTQKIIGSKSKSTSVRSKEIGTIKRNTRSNTSISRSNGEPDSQVFRCGICNREFGYTSSLYVHLNLFHKIPCKVSNCVEINAKLDKLSATNNDVSGSPRLRCDTCDRQFDNNRGLSTHLIRVHQVQRKESTCVQDSTDIAKSAAHTIHADTSNSNIIPAKFDCNICNRKGFDKKRGLWTHLLMAHGIRSNLKSRVEANSSLVNSSTQEDELSLPSPDNTAEPEDIPKCFCIACSRQFRNDRALCAHLRQAHHIKCTRSESVKVGAILSKSLQTNSSSPPVLNRTSILTSNQSFQCGACDKICAKESSLVSHLFRAHGIRSTKSDCVDISANLAKPPKEVAETDVPPTEIVDSSSSSFQCGTCSREFGTERGLCLHLVKTHKEQFTRSTTDDGETNETAETSSAPKQTNTSHSSPSDFICRLCDKECAKKNSLCIHLFQEHHIRTKRSTCVEVNSKLAKPATEESDSSSHAPNNTSILTSELDNSNNTSIHHCKTCNMKFASRISLCMHLIKTHKVQSNHPASSTNFVKSPKSNFSPTGSNSVLENKCDVCHRKFGSKSAVNMHFSLVHKRRMISTQNTLVPDKYDPNNYCRVCNKALSSAVAFRSHLLLKHQMFVEPSHRKLKSNDYIIPDKEDPNNYCHACDRTYASKGSYWYHLHTRHGIPRTEYTTTGMSSSTGDSDINSQCLVTTAAATQGSSNVQNLISTNASKDTVISSSPDLYCKECNFLYISIGSYKTHMYNHHSATGRKNNTRKRTRSIVARGAPAGCGNTNVDDTDSCNAKHHKTKVTDVTDVKGKTYKENKGTKWSNPNIRPDIEDPNFYCKSCQITLETKAAYQNHLTIIHKMYVPEETFNCAPCKKSYRTKEHFNNHLTHFHNSTPLKKRITSIASTKRKAPAKPTKETAVSSRKEPPEVDHCRVQHVCDVCQEAQKTNQELREHRQDIHGISVEFDIQQKYCNLCQSRYNDRKGYQLHLLLTHGLKPPSSVSAPIADSHCKECDIAYRSTVHYQLHCFKHHGLEL